MEGQNEEYRQELVLPVIRFLKLTFLHKGYNTIASR